MIIFGLAIWDKHCLVCQAKPGFPHFADVRRSVFRTELFDLYSCIFCIQAIPISRHPSFHPMFSFPNRFNWNWCTGKCIWHVLLQGCKAVITIFTELSLHWTPEELNGILAERCTDGQLFRWPLGLVTPENTFNITFLCRFCVQDYLPANLSTFSCVFFLVSRARAAASVCTFRRAM